MADYTGKIVRFKAKVELTQLEDKSLLINWSTKQRFKENNGAAHMLLYLIMRDRGEEIDFNGLKKHVLNQYNLDDAGATAALNTFLEKLEYNYGLIESFGGTGTQDTDPLDLYPAISPKLPWQTPDLFQRAHAKDKYKASTVYSGGYVRITYRP